MKVFISSRSFGKIESGAVELLKKAGLTPILNPYGRKLTEQEILDLQDDAVGIIAGTEKITDKIISNNNQLKVISRYGIGLDNIDLKTAKERNVMVYNTPETPTVAVAEFTLSLILNLLKNINIADRYLREDKWKPTTGNLLSGKVIGIIGLGRIGKKLVQFLTPFDLKILAYDIEPDIDFIKEYGIELVKLERIFSKSDIITVHVSLTEQTRNIIGKEELESMKDNTLLINTARGELIDEKALIDSLKNKKIAGAALDVFKNEPNTGALKNFDNVILTPHIAAYSIETRKQMELETVNNLMKGLKEIKII